MSTDWLNMRPNTWSVVSALVVLVTGVTTSLNMIKDGLEIFFNHQYQQCEWNIQQTLVSFNLVKSCFDLMLSILLPPKKVFVFRHVVID